MEEQTKKENKVTNEIDEMLKSLTEPSGDTSEEAIEDESKDESIDDTINEEEVKDSEEKSDEEEHEEESEEGTEESESDKVEDGKSEEDEKIEEPDEKDQTIADLRKQLAERKEEVKVEEKEKVEEEPTSPEPLKLETQDFIGDVEIEDVLGDKDSFNTILNAVYSKGVTDARTILEEQVLRDIPNIVRTNVSLMTEMKDSSDKFYTENPDLVPFKKVVATVFEEVASDHPDKDYKELLNEVGKEARHRLDLHKKAVENPTNKQGPRLPKSRGGSRNSDGQPDVSPLQKELAAMDKVVRR